LVALLVNARFNEEDWWAPLHAASSQGYRKLVAGAVSAQLLLQSLRTMFNTPVAVFECRRTQIFSICGTGSFARLSTSLYTQRSSIPISLVVSPGFCDRDL
jgi:hypothetical protein